MEYRLLSEGGTYFLNKAPPLKHGLKIKSANKRSGRNMK